MPNEPEPKRPNDEDTVGLILAAIIGFVLFTLLGKLIRRPILLAVVIGSPFGLYGLARFLWRAFSSLPGPLARGNGALEAER